MQTTGRKGFNPGHPTLIGEGTWHWSQNHKEIGKDYQPKPLIGLIGHRERWRSWRQQLLQMGDHNELRDEIHYIRHRPINTHGEGPYREVSVPLMAILSGRRWNKARRNSSKHASIRGISLFTHHHPIRRFSPNTWRLARQPGSNIISSNSSNDSLACAILQHTHQQSTTTFKGIYSNLMRKHHGFHYKNMGNCPVLLIVLQVRVKSGSAHKSGLSRASHESLAMEAGGSRCTAANRDLQEARGGYETRTATRIKRKMADLEAQAKLEEGGRMNMEIAAEVNWLTDPDTPTKRATQFVRTQAESWRTKTLIAKALESIEKDRQHIVIEVNLTEDQMAKIIDYNSSLDSKINTVTEAVKTLNRMLMLLIRLLKDSINTAPAAQPATSAANHAAQPATSVANKPGSLEEMQAKVDSHVRDIGLDTIT